MSRDILERLKDAAVVALRIDGDDWPRSLLSSTLIPDAWMGLVERRDGTRRFVPAGEDPRPEGADKLLLARCRAITVPVDIEDDPAACGNLVSGVCEVLVRWEPRDVELAALGRTLLAKGDLTLEKLARAFVDGGGRAALRRFIGAQPAATLVREDLRPGLLEALLERVAKLELSSDTLRVQEARRRAAAERLERIEARGVVEQAALAATKRRLDHLSDVLGKLESIAAGDQKMHWHDLLPTLSPADRGRLLENLWRITPDRHVADAIVVVAGNGCLWFDPAEPERIARRITLPNELGGLRSVTFSPQKRWLLVGAAGGVWALDADAGAVAAKFAVPDITPPRTGFNAAVIAGERLFATSSQLGCWSWSVADPSDARGVLVPEGGVPRRVRAVVATDDARVLFGADETVHVCDAETGEAGPLGNPGGVIQCLTLLEEQVYAGTADGRLFRGNVGRPGEWTLVHQSLGPIESVAGRRWSDLVELVVPAGARGICGIYAEQGIVTYLLESATPIRRAWACDDVVVGLNDLRDRLVVMNANLPERTGREACIARLTSQTIQDACIVLRPEGPEAASDEGAPA
jgi:hypothetical protein